jgi:hypothetical protein
MKRWKAALGALAVGCTFAGGSSAVAAATATPAPGKIKVFVTQVSATKGLILITGAIGDYGTTLTVDKNGKADANGDFQKVSLIQGGFLVNATAYVKKINRLKPQVNAATCSFSASGSGPGTLADGTGLYNGIGGKVTITSTFAGVAPRYKSGSKKGQCNLGQKTQPLDQYSSITASGNVTFS